MPKQQVVGSMARCNPDIPLYVYHENSYDGKNFDEEIAIESLPPNCKPIDLFKCWDNIENLENGWLEEFVDS